MKFVKSLFGKIFIIFAVLFFISYAFLIYVDLQSAEKQIVSSEKETLNRLNKILQKQIESTMLQGEKMKEIKKFFSFLEKEPKFKGARLLDSNHKVILSIIREEEGKKLKLSKKQKNFYYLKPIKNTPACFKCHSPNKKKLGFVQFTTSLDSSYKRISNLRLLHITIAVITFSIISLATFFLIRFLVNRPVKEILNTIAKVEEGSYNVRAEVNVGGELGKIAKNLNRMIYKVKESQNQVEQLHQEQIRHIDKLVSLGELAATLAHEVKNPLTGIGSAVEVLQSELSSNDSRYEIFSEILNQVKRLRRTIDNLLGYARPKSPVLQEIEIHIILEETFILLSKQIEMQKIKVKKQYEAKYQNIIVDIDQMTQVFLNIILNAIQSMPSGGALTISTKKDIETNFLNVYITDTGIGIDEEVIEKIFNPFFSTKAKGSGLGLAICERIINMHNGKIEVKSQHGKGTTFTIKLPNPNESEKKFNYKKYEKYEK